MKKHVGRTYVITLIIFILLGVIPVFQCSNPSQPVIHDVMLVPMNDTTVDVKDAIVLHVHNASDNTKNVRFFWSFDKGASFRDSTVDTVMVHRFSLLDTGNNMVSVKAVDQRGKTTGTVSFAIIVKAYRPSISSQEEVVASVGDSLAFRANAYDSNGTIVAYFWAIDGNDFSLVTPTGLLSWPWGFYQAGTHVVNVKALDDDSLFSPVVTTRVIVAPNAPQVHWLIPDTAISINDTLMLRAIAIDEGGTVARYVWALNGVDFRDSTSSGSLVSVWRKPDAGKHTIRVKAINGHGVESSADSMHVTVDLDAPAVTFMKDTTLFINDTLVLRARGTDKNGRVVKYLWALDGVYYRDTTFDDTMMTVWPRSAAGKRTLKVKVLDNDTLLSSPDSMTVNVNIGMPYIKPLGDTLVSIHDTVVVKITAFDTNGTITSYYWNSHDAGWDETSTSNFKKIYKGSNDTQKVIVGAMDNDGNLASDTFTIRYNNPPRQLIVTRPAASDTILFRLFDSSYVKGQVFFKFSAIDPDGPRDTLKYFLYLGKRPDSLSLMYAGFDTAYTVSKADTTHYFWKIVCKDRFGDSTSASGAFTCLLQKTICFAGHSIVDGDMGDGVSGGFRAEVLSALRKPKISTKCVQPVGPLCAGNMSNKTDDSCYAMSGSFASFMYTMLTQGFPQLNADLWVLMIGVNKAYDITESQGTINLINEAHRRNPQAGIYVLKGLPYPDYYASGYMDRVNSYNTMLTDTLAARRAQGWRAWVVDAYSVVVKSDSTIDYTYSDDGIHPNQLGYTLIGKAIIDTMQAHP